MEKINKTSEKEQESYKERCSHQKRDLLKIRVYALLILAFLICFPIVLGIMSVSKI